MTDMSAMKSQLNIGLCSLCYAHYKYKLFTVALAATWRYDRSNGILNNARWRSVKQS